jgi:hypothetical protein
MANEGADGVPMMVKESADWRAWFLRVIQQGEHPYSPAGRRQDGSYSRGMKPR